MSNIKSYKVQLDHMRTMIEIMTKASESYTLSMIRKSTFNIIGPMFQGIWILDLGVIDHINSFLILFNLYSICMSKWLENNLLPLQILLN